MNIFFITFGSNGYERAVNRICRQASEFGIFNSINGFIENDLDKFEEFKSHIKFCENNQGFGYWIWKAFLIRKTLEIMENEDILLYCDAGCELKASGKKRMLEYIEMVKNSESGILAFQLPFEEKLYTKMDLLNHLNFTSEEQMNSLQNLATTIFLENVIIP